MRESHQQHVTLQIQASEEDALMDTLNFMYSNTLPRTTPTALLNILMVADKFEVASCMRYCTQLLCALPMTCESALLYLVLPSPVLIPDRVHQLRDAAKKFLADHFKDFTKCQKEVLKLPLAGLEAVLSSDELRAVCEEEIYEFVLKWARLHYPKLEERRGILSKHILQFVRFPFMSLEPLKEVISCVEIESEVATKIVLDALSFKAEIPQRQRSLASDNPSFRQFVERPYMNKHVKVVELELPRPKFIVYMSLKREECEQMYPSGHITSQSFHSGEQTFVLSGVCATDATQSHHQFGLFLFVQSKVEFTVDYEGAAIMKPSEDFVRKKKGRNTFTAGKDKSFHRIFSMLWAEFMAEDSPYFINGVLHLKVELTIEELTSPR